MKTIVLADPFFTGHHPTYILIYMRALLSLGFKVIVFTKNPIDLKTQYEISGEPIGNYEIYKIIDTPLFKSQNRFSNFRYSLNLWLNLRKTIQSSIPDVKIDLVYILWLDSYLAPFLHPIILDFIFPYKWTGLYFHPHRNRKEYSKRLKNLNIAFKEICCLSNNCKFISILDEGIQNIQNIYLPNKVFVFPDATDESMPEVNHKIIHEIKNKINDKKIIGLLGPLSKRKGFLDLLKIALKTKDQKYLFIFAGYFPHNEYSSGELKIIDDANKIGNCIFIKERIISEKLFNAIINLCDVIYAAYHNFEHSSNILAKASVFHKPVIVSSGFCMEERVRKYNLGSVIREGNVQEGIDNINKLLTKNENIYGFKKYYSKHSEKQLKIILFQQIKNIL